MKRRTVKKQIHRMYNECGRAEKLYWATHDKKLKPCSHKGNKRLKLGYYKGFRYIRVQQPTRNLKWGGLAISKRGENYATSKI